MSEITVLSPKERALRNINEDYKEKFGFHDPENYAFKSEKGLSREIVEQISEHKSEPEWMRKFRLKALDHFESRPMPKWGADLSTIDFNDIHYFVRAADKQGENWDEVPEEIKETFDKLGIPEAERKFLAGVGAQYECLAEDTLVYTDRGLIPIKDIRARDTVFSWDEEKNQLTTAPVKRNTNKGRRPVYRVRVGCRSIRATDNHPFLCLAYERNPGKQRGHYHKEWRYLCDLNPGDLVAVSKKLPEVGKSVKLDAIFNGHFNHHRDKQITIPKTTSPSLMWWLGVYLGDGFIHNSNGRKKRVEVALPAGQPELRQAMLDETNAIFGIDGISKQADRITVGTTQLSILIENLGFGGKSKTKQLPEWVFSIPHEERLALIAGYVDSDGYVRDHRSNKDTILTSANRAMLGQIRELVLSCSLSCSQLAEFEYTLHTSGNTAKGFRLMISGDLSHLPFRNPDRANRVGKHIYTHDYSSAKGTTFRSHVSESVGFVRIDSIDQDGEAEVHDIEVDGPHNFVAEGIVVHNSEVVYHQINEKLEEQGVIFLDMDTGLREHEGPGARVLGDRDPTERQQASCSQLSGLVGRLVRVHSGRRPR